MNLSDYSQLLLPAIEEELKSVAAEAAIQEDDSLHAMLCYHMGWRGAGAGEQAQGKRVRPLLLLLSTLACGGEWQVSLPAATAVELIHNFSLIHDDIEDNSETRRGRPTLWTQHGLPLALNAGDGMFAMAFLALQRLSPQLEPVLVMQAYTLLSQTCLALTKGQHLDISFEQQELVSTEDYFQMIAGKTASLLAGATQLGAILAGASPETVDAMRRLGHNLGIAFQIHDDYLGIWGDPEVTGKSAASDLVARKKSLPILFGLEQNEEFSQHWRSGDISTENAGELAELLAQEGARDYTQEQSEHFTHLALEVFQHLPKQNSAVEALEELAHRLLNRSA